MTKFRNKGNESTLFEKRDVLLSENTIEQYAQQFGDERALGYMEAVRDFVNQFELMVAYGGRSGHLVRKDVKTLYAQNFHFITDFIDKRENKIKSESLSP